MRLRFLVCQCFRLPAVSSLWTPEGERPVGPPETTSGVGAPGSAVGPSGPGAGEPPPDEEALAAQVEDMRAELANAPVEVVVANHCYGLFELAAVYLSQAPPLLSQARLAIDALSSLVDGLEGRLGEGEPNLKDGLGQLRLAYVQIDGAQRAGEQIAARANSANGADDAATGAGAGSGADPEAEPGA